MSKTLTTRILLLLLSASSAQAAVQVTFVGGRSLLAESIEIHDGRATLTLDGGGTLTLESRRILSAETIDVPAPVESPPLVLSTAAPVAADPHPAPAPGRPAPVVVVPPPAPTASPTPAPIDYAALIQDAAKRYQVDAELLKCVLEVESGFNSGAVSPKGAMGVAQLMPETARDLGVRNPFDPVQAVDGAARHLHDLLARSGGRFVPALAAYNAGEGTVRRYGGLPPYHETIAYIERILTLYGSR